MDTQSTQSRSGLFGRCCPRDYPPSCDGALSRECDDFCNIENARISGSYESSILESFNAGAREVDGLFAGINYLNETEPQEECGDVLLDEDSDDGKSQQTSDRYFVVRPSTKPFYTLEINFCR